MRSCQFGLDLEDNVTFYEVIPKLGNQFFGSWEPFRGTVCLCNSLRSHLTMHEASSCKGGR